ncbi:unnamed protein product [Prunus armeniaca]
MNAWLPQASYPCGGCSTPGESPRRNAPSPSTGWHAATRSHCLGSSTGSGLGPSCPTLRANPFPKFTNLFCQTSLVYIVPSTRGCSSWRPDTVMSTIGREWHSVLRIFKGRWGRIGHHAMCSALPGWVGC